MKTGILGFCGPKFSGKSTAASIFQELFPGPTEELAFAGRLKEVCSEVFNLDMANFLDPKLKEKELGNWIHLTTDLVLETCAKFDINSVDYDLHVRPHLGKVFETPRQLLQYVGTEVLRGIDQGVHVNYTLAHKSPDKLSILTDVRFESEYEAVKSQPNSLVIFVKNDRAELQSQDGHPSEREVFLFSSKCKQLPNNGTLGELREQIKGLIDVYYP